MAYFQDDGNVYHTTFDCNTSWGGADESVTAHLTIPLARNGYNNAMPRDIKVMFCFRKASISPSTYYFTINSGGFWNINSTSSMSDTMSRSGSTFSFTKTTNDIPLYEIQSDNSWGHVIFQTKNKVIPAGTTINFNVTKSFVTKATTWTTNSSTFATERGYIPHKTSAYSSGLWGVRCYTNNQANLFSYIFSFGSSYKYKVLNIGSNYIYLVFYAGNATTKYVTVNPGDTFYMYETSSSSQSGSPARWTYNKTTTIYCYVNGSLAAYSSYTNSSSSSSGSYPSSYYYAYAKTNDSNQNRLGIVYVGRI